MPQPQHHQSLTLLRKPILSASSLSKKAAPIKVTLITLLLLMGGCVSTSEEMLVEQVSEPVSTLDNVTEPAADTADLDKLLPKMELNETLLEQLLVANFSSYVADWHRAATNAMAAAKSSQDYRVARLAALLAMRAKDYSTATRSAELWVTLNESSSDAKNTLLLAQLGANDIEAAYASFIQRQGKQSVDDYIKDISSVLLRQGNAEAALAIVERYVQAHPKSAQVALSATYVAENFAAEHRAEKWLEQALVLKPNWDLAAQMKANILRRQGKDEEHSNYIEQFVADNPTSIGMRINVAADLARKEKFTEALTLMQAVIKDDRKNIAALNYSAALARHLEQVDLAKGYYKKALRLDPKNDEIRWALAGIAVQEEKYPLAERYYQAIKGQENYFRAQLQVSNMRYLTRGLKSAIDTLRALNPRTEAEYIDRATTRHYLLMKDNQYEEAFGAINETLAYLPENLDLVYARALVAAELGELKTAEEDFRFIISKHPNHADALNALGYTLADQTDRYEEAKELIAKALELRPKDAHILDSMGWVFFRLKQHDQAIDYLQQAYDEAPEAEVAAHLGEVFWVKGEVEKAKLIWQEAFEKESDNPLLTKTLERFGIEFQAVAKEDG